MRTSTLLILGGAGVLGYLWWRRQQQRAYAATQVPIVAAPNTPPSVLDALTTGLQAGIDAGTYDAAAIRNAMYSASSPGAA